MNRLRPTFLALCVLLSTTPAMLAGPDETVHRAGIVRQGVSATSFSQELPVLARIQGTAFFRTFVAMTNNTNASNVTASFQFTYTCLSSTCNPSGAFTSTAVQTVPLPSRGSFVKDDFIDYLNSQGLLMPGANAGTIGTLLVTFNNLPSSMGWEANTVARVYNRIAESDPSQGTVGFAFNASEFFDSADTQLIGYGHDTKAAPTIAGKVRTNVGVRNTDINGTGAPLTVNITCFDTATGAQVGSPFSFAALRPGEIRQIADLWTTLGISPAVTDVIIFADAANPSLTSPTMEGYVTLVEGQNTQDAALFTMICADVNLCGN